MAQLNVECKVTLDCMKPCVKTKQNPKHCFWLLASVEYLSGSIELADASFLCLLKAPR